MPAQRQAPRQAGFTLVELLTTVAIVGVLAAVAAPSFNAFNVRERLKGAATNLYTDLQFARSEAVQRNAPITVSFNAGSSWCYGIHQGSTACNCASANSCSIKTVSSSSFPTITLAQAQFSSLNGAASWYAISPLRGQSLDASGNPVSGSATFEAEGSLAMRGDLNAVGRLRLCSPSGSISGYPTC